MLRKKRRSFFLFLDFGKYSMDIAYKGTEVYEYIQYLLVWIIKYFHTRTMYANLFHIFIFQVPTQTGTGT